MDLHAAETPAQGAVRAALGRRRNALLATVRRRSGGKVDAEDVLQVALTRALEHADRLRDPGRAEAWISRIVRNVLIDELRKGQESAVPIDDQLPNAIEDNGIDCWCVLAQAEQLKSEYAVIIRRVVVEGASLATVGAELGLTQNNATVRLHRAKKALRARLLAHCGTTRAQSCSDCGCEERGCCVRPASLDE